MAPGKLYKLLKQGYDAIFKREIVNSKEFCCAVKKIIEQYLIVVGPIPKVTNCAALPDPALHNGEIYAVLNSTGSKWSPTWLGGGTFCPKGFWISDGAAWNYLGEFPNQADQATVDAGVDDTEFVTPKTLTNSAQLLAKQVNIQLKDEGISLGSSGTVNELDFVGGGVTASRLGDKVTISIPSPIPGGYNYVNVSTTPYNIIQTAGTHVFLVDASLGNIILNLPTAVGNSAEYQFKKTDNTNNTVTVIPFGAELIDGDLLKTILFKNTTFSIVSNNINFYRNN